MHTYLGYFQQVKYFSEFISKRKWKIICFLLISYCHCMRIFYQSSDTALYVNAIIMHAYRTSETNFNNKVTSWPVNCKIIFLNHANFWFV